MLKSIPKGLRLEFVYCAIHADAAESLKQLLLSGSVEELTIVDCRLDKEPDIDTILACGLEKNQSLLSFTYMDTNPYLSLMAAIPIMVARNQNMEKLGVDLETARRNSHAMFQAIETAKSLKSIQIRSHRSCMTVATIQRIIQTCAATEILKELDLDCRCSKNALQLLLQQLSERAIINSLNLRCFSNIQRQLAMLKVRRLVASVSTHNWILCLEELATNNYIQHVSLRTYSVGSFNDEFVNRLRDGQRPIELILTGAIPTLSTLPSITDDDQCHGGLKSITCQTVFLDLLDFTPRLVDLRGIRKLTIRDFPTSAFTEAFFVTLAQTLVQNRTLCTVSVHTDVSRVIENPSVRKYLETIRCSLAINRVSQFFITDNQDQVPASLWPWVLASSSSDPEGIFCALREMPNIVEWGARAPAAALPTVLEDDRTMMPNKRARRR